MISFENKKAILNKLSLFLGLGYAEDNENYDYASSRLICPNGDKNKVELCFDDREDRFEWVMPEGEIDDGDYDWKTLSPESEKLIDNKVKEFCKINKVEITWSIEEKCGLTFRLVEETRPSITKIKMSKFKKNIFIR